MLLSHGNSGSRPLRPFTNIETVEPRGAACVAEFTEPSALSTTGNRLGLATSIGTWIGVAARPLTVNCIAAKPTLKLSCGTARLIWVEDAYRSGASSGPGGNTEADVGAKLTRTPP